MLKRRLTPITMLALVVVLSVAALGWACTPKARVFGLNIAAGPPRTAVLMNGEAVTPGAPVQIRWNSLEGPELAAATADASGNFAASFQLPDVAPDIYYVVALTAGQDVARVALEVTSPEASPSSTYSSAQIDAASADLWQGFSDSSSRAGAEPQAAGDPHSGNPAGMTAGIALLAAGAMILAGGTVALVRRRNHAAV